MELGHRELNDRNLNAQNAKYKKGVVSSVHASSWTADVVIIGNEQTVLKNIPISCALGLHDIQVGDKCRIDVFDETNPGSDMVIAYTYGRARYLKANSGFTSVPGNSTNFGIPHGLPGIPNIASVGSDIGSVGAGGGQPPLVWLSTNKMPDATNIYVTTSSVAAKSIYWAAAIVE